jgi:hypothetical protein
LKLPQLLSQFLYQTKKLDLPGIGSFTLDAAAVIPQESDRMGHVPASGISFKNANIPIADDVLVNFIKDHTRKMKSLAASDLDFYLTTGRQLLNIGKPFYLEGIGTLIKNKEGKLDFSQGEYLIARMEDPGASGRTGVSGRTTDATGSFDDSARQEAAAGRNSRQTLLLVGLIVGLIVIAWGGYYLYKRNNYVAPSAADKATVVPEGQPAAQTDSTTATHTAGDTSGRSGGAGGAGTGAGSTAAAATGVDSTKKAVTAIKTPPTTAPAQFNPVPGVGQSLYHFVILRTENKGHALRRYNQLLGFQLNIRIEQKDSTFFKLYFPIAAAPKDTTHIKDSLADVYASRITIEQ